MPCRPLCSEVCICLSLGNRLLVQLVKRQSEKKKLSELVIDVSCESQNVKSRRSWVTCEWQEWKERSWNIGSTHLAVMRVIEKNMHILCTAQPLPGSLSHSDSKYYIQLRFIDTISAKWGKLHFFLKIRLDTLLIPNWESAHWKSK